jgi:hypothetical protein
VNHPVAELSDQILTLSSVGAGAGVVVAQCETTQPTADGGQKQSRVVTETVWTGRAEKAAITVAVSEVLGDLEGVEPGEMGIDAD